MRKSKFKCRPCRPFLLLEVLIAFALIALCAIPLISPHISMIKAQNELTTSSKMNHAANLIYAHFLEKMHKNEIALTDLENGRMIPVPEEFLEGLKGYKSFCCFIKKKSKEIKQVGFINYFGTIEISFNKENDREKKSVFKTDVFFLSKTEQSANLQDNTPSNNVLPNNTQSNSAKPKNSSNKAKKKSRVTRDESEDDDEI